MTDIDHAMSRLTDHLQRLRQQSRGLTHRHERAQLRALELHASNVAKKMSEARRALEEALAFVHDHDQQETAP